ncbi:MAG TPA: hypothetical protein VHC69_04045 [Polyangiaceae bacterium]|nr:hypothetical protein [Polyangiaceae bacterium]
MPRRPLPAGRRGIRRILAPHVRDPHALDPEVWASADAVLAWHELRLDATVIEKLERCRVIVRVGVGYDNVDIAAAGRRGIPACNVPDYGTHAAADHAIALYQALRRRGADAPEPDDPDGALRDAARKLREASPLPAARARFRRRP